MRICFARLQRWKYSVWLNRNFCYNFLDGVICWSQLDAHIERHLFLILFLETKEEESGIPLYESPSGFAWTFCLLSILNLLWLGVWKFPSFAMVSENVLQGRTKSIVVRFSIVFDAIFVIITSNNGFDLEKERFDVNDRLISTRMLEEDTVIPDISQEAVRTDRHEWERHDFLFDYSQSDLWQCAKFCSEEERFTCVGFQHSLLSRDCRLLDLQFSQKSAKPTLRGLWVTFVNNGNFPSYLPVSEGLPPFGIQLVLLVLLSENINHISWGFSWF